MDSKLQSYFCYLNQGQPVIVEKEPANFNQLPFHYTTLCPNTEIAKLAYQTNLRIMKWRSAGK